MSDNVVEVKVSGDSSGAEAAMIAAAAAVKDGVSTMKSSLDSLDANFKQILSGFGMISAALAGGAAFKAFVSGANNVTKEALTLGKSLGVTATEASYFGVALAHVGVSQETVTTAANKITQTLLKNEDSFKKLGVSTRDASGNFRSTGDIMQDTNARLREFKEGTDRNIEGMKIYGKSWADVAPMVTKFKGVTEESRQEAEALNLVVGQEAVSALADYKVANVGVSEVMEGITNTVGQAIIPRLTDLAHWFSSIGPDAVSVTRGVMEGYIAVQDSIKDSIIAVWNVLRSTVSSIVDIFVGAFGKSGSTISAMDIFNASLQTVQVMAIGFRITIEEVCSTVQGALNITINVFKGLAAVAIAALHLDWQGVKDAASDAGGAIAANFRNTVSKMVDIAVKGNADIAAAMSKKPTDGKKQTAIAEKEKSGETSEGGEKKPKEDKTRTKEWELANNNAKAAYELLHELRARDLGDDVKYWQSKLALTVTGSKEQAEVTKQLEAAQKAVMLQQYKTDSEMAALAIAKTKADAEETLAVDTENAKQKVSLGLMTQQQMIAAEQGFEARRTAIVQQSINDRIALYAKDPQRTPEGLAKINAELEAEERTHQKTMNGIANEQTKEDLTLFTSLSAGMSSQWDKGINALIAGTLTWKNSFKSVVNEIEGVFLKFVADKAKAWIQTEVLQTACTKAQTAIRGVLTKAGLITDTTATVTAATTKVGAEAVAAGAGAAASQAAIPIVGPELGVGAMAMMMAAVMGLMSSIPGHAVGAWNIPSDGITKVHKGETILNASDSENFRNARSGGGGGDVHLHVQAMDGKSVARLFQENSPAMADALKRHASKFGM